MNIREILANVTVMPELRVDEVAHALPLAKALLAGGLRAFEINVRSKAGLAAIETVRKGAPEATIGASGLNRAVDFAAAGRLNVHFGSSPGFTPELAAAARGARFPLLPGVMTPSEILAARAAGFHDMKFFPAGSAGGPKFMRCMAEEFPEEQFCPAGAPHSEIARDYLSLPNVLCISVQWVAPRVLVGGGRWSEIEALAREAAGYRRQEGPDSHERSDG